MKCIHSLIACAATSAMLLSSAAFSQGTADAYPSKPVLIIIPYAAGGPVDTETRFYTPKLSELLGKPILVDFKPGATNTIGLAYVAKAAPDGYTLVITGGNFSVLPALFNGLPFDIIKDFAAISVVSEKPTVLVVRESFPARNLAEYLAYAKANPGKLNYGTTGAGSNQHLVGAWLHNVAQTGVTFVHYKGAAPLNLDLVAGRVDVSSTTVLAVLPQIKSGKVRALAVTDRARSKILPDTPTLTEQGVNLVYANWTGILAPGATPAAIVNKLSDAFAKVVRAPDVIAKLEAAGNVPVGNTPVQFRQLVATETAIWQKVVKDAGIKVEK